MGSFALYALVRGVTVTRGGWVTDLLGCLIPHGEKRQSNTS